MPCLHRSGLFRCAWIALVGASLSACAGDQIRGSSAQIAVACPADDGVPAATCSEIDFGDVGIGQTATRTVTVANSGRVVLTVSKTSWTPESSPFSATALAPSLKSAALATIELSFTPTASGPSEAVYAIESNAQNTPRVEIHVKGKGIGPVSVEVTPSPIDFGDVVVNQTEDRSLTVKNTDIGPFEIISATIAAGGSAFALSTTTQTTLEPGASTVFTASYAPTAVGEDSGQVELQFRRVGSADVSVTTVTVPLQGRAVLPAWCTGAIGVPLCDCGPQSTCAPGGGCQSARRVFLSRTMMNGNLQGVANADALCNDYATKGALGGTWMAFVGDSSTSPSKHFALASVPYAQLDGTIVANNGAGLVSGSLLSGISLDECGTVTESAEVWTGLSSASASSGSGCQNFTSSSGSSDYASVGLSGRKDYSWVNVYLQFCDRGNVRIYCVEQ